MAALLRSNAGSTDRCSVSIAAPCQRMGIELMPPDCNASAYDVHLQIREMRLSLLMDLDVGRQAMWESAMLLGSPAITCGNRS